MANFLYFQRQTNIQQNWEEDDGRVFLIFRYTTDSGKKMGFGNNLPRVQSPTSLLTSCRNLTKLLQLSLSLFPYWLYWDNKTCLIVLLIYLNYIIYKNFSLRNSGNDSSHNSSGCNTIICNLLNLIVGRRRGSICLVVLADGIKRFILKVIEETVTCFIIHQEYSL